MLSREYYYLGTQLPMDRFLTFYYGHPGFHINNILVILSVQLFMFSLVFLGTLNKQLTICKYTSDGQFVGGQGGCYNLVPVYDWIKRCIISIFIVFFIGESLFPRPRSDPVLTMYPRSLPAALPARVDGAWSRSSRHPTREALPLPLAHLRSLRYPDLVPLDPQQLDVWRCEVHRHRSRIRDDEDLVCDSLLAIRRTVDLPRYEDVAPPTLRHAIDMALPL